MVGKGDKFEDLYVLDKSNLDYVFAAYENNISAHIWNNRLGYLSFRHLEILKHHLHCDI